MRFTIEKAAADAQYDLKRLTDDRHIMRRELGIDILPAPENGRITCGVDDCAVLQLYADMRRAGQPVKVAGITASRIRDAMREHPNADQLTICTLANGLIFTRPSADLDLSTGFNSGSYVTTALLVDVRNLKDRVQRAIDAYEPVIGAEDEAA